MSFGKSLSAQGASVPLVPAVISFPPELLPARPPLSVWLTEPPTALRERWVVVVVVVFVAVVVFGFAGVVAVLELVVDAFELPEDFAEFAATKADEFCAWAARLRSARRLAAAAFSAAAALWAAAFFAAAFFAAFCAGRRLENCESPWFADWIVIVACATVVVFDACCSEVAWDVGAPGLIDRRSGASAR
jgi:hypothetical protein